MVMGRYLCIKTLIINIREKLIVTIDCILHYALLLKHIYYGFAVN
jgi:hypothetical protein